MGKCVHVLCVREKIFSINTVICTPLLHCFFPLFHFMQMKKWDKHIPKFSAEYMFSCNSCVLFTKIRQDNG